MRRKLKKAICLLSCTFLFAMPFCFMASAETTTFSNSNLTYGDYELNHTGNLVSTTISIVYSGSSRVFVLKSSSYANFGFLQFYNKNGGFIFKNPSQYPARFSLYVNTYTGSSQTVMNYQHSLTAFINGSISAGVNLLGRDSQVSRWEIYYEIPAGINFQLDSIDISCSFPAQAKTCEFWVKSPTLTYKTDGEFVVDGMHDTIIGNVDPANPPQYSPPAASDAIGNLDALQSQLDNAKKSWNPMIFDLTGFGNAFAGLRLAFDSIVGSFGSDFGVVLKVSIIFGCVSLLVGLVINASVSSIKSEQRQARENAHERERNSYK